MSNQPMIFNILIDGMNADADWKEFRLNTLAGALGLKRYTSMDDEGYVYRVESDVELQERVDQCVRDLIWWHQSADYIPRCLSVTGVPLSDLLAALNKLSPEAQVQGNISKLAVFTCSKAEMADYIRIPVNSTQEWLEEAMERAVAHFEEQFDSEVKYNLDAIMAELREKAEDGE